MGKIHNLLDRRPYCAYRMPMGPTESVRKALEFWSGLGCRMTPYDIDAELRPAGWTGVELTGGSSRKDFAKSFISDSDSILGILNFSKRFRRWLPNEFALGIAAPLNGSGPGGTELVCFQSGLDAAGADLSSPGEYIEYQLEELGKALGAEGLLLAPARPFRERDMPEDHPLRLVPWLTARKKAKKALKQQKRQG